MVDVAALAGVSMQTVSRVLNDPSKVRPATRSRVEAAIRTLGYRPNRAARALVTRRTRIIGVVSPGESRFGPTNVMLAIEEAARDAGYATTIAVIRDAEEASVEAALEHFMNVGVDGIVVIAPHVRVAPVAHRLVEDVPVVLIAAGYKPSPGLNVVATDQELGARLATKHLLELGHREVLHVSGPSEWFDARSRIFGWRSEMQAAGISEPRLIVGSWDASRGYEVGQLLVAKQRLPSAIFASNDQLALGILRAFGEAGVTVPDDVSLVGFDDIEGSEWFLPPLTTVRQPFPAIGRRSVDVIINALNGDSPSASVIPPELVIRSSTGSPRQSKACAAVEVV